VAKTHELYKLKDEMQQLQRARVGGAQSCPQAAPIRPSSSRRAFWIPRMCAAPERAAVADAERAEERLAQAAAQNIVPAGTLRARAVANGRGVAGQVCGWVQLSVGIGLKRNVLHQGAASPDARPRHC
jgi:hypothetical protein